MASRSQPHYPYVTRVLIDLFESGELAEVEAIDIEPDYGWVGRITYRNGAARFFRGTGLGLNNLGASEVARDKGYTGYFLERLGYRRPRAATFLTEAYASAIAPRLASQGFERFRHARSATRTVAEDLGYPVYVKPNNGSQGRGVVKCWDEDDLKWAISGLEEARARVFIVEAAVDLSDYRVVVFDGRIISAYERRPLAVTGDGGATAAELLEVLQASYADAGRDTVIPVADARFERSLARQGYGRGSVVPVGVHLRVADASNLSLGGTAVEVTDSLHPHWHDLCRRLVADMDLVLCGVDLACADITAAGGDYAILEINAAPGLDNYAASGPEQRRRVRELYREIFSGPPPEPRVR